MMERTQSGAGLEACWALLNALTVLACNLSKNTATDPNATEIGIAMSAGPSPDARWRGAAELGGACHAL